MGSLAGFASSLADRLDAQHRSTDPVGWIGSELNEHLWSGQRAIAASVVTHRSTAVPAAHGLGKSRSAADLGLWWARTKEDPFVITTAPTASQVASILWREIKSQHEANALPGRITMSGYPQLHDGGRLVGLGRKPSDYDDSVFQGYHCFDAQTELLTDQGWKSFPKVTGDERVLTLNGDVAEWGPITQVVRQPFDGYLNVHDGARVNFAITDNHRLLVRGIKPTYHKNSRLTIEDGDLIKKRRAAGESLAVLAADFGVSQQLICDVAKGRRDGKLRTGAIDAPRWQLREYADLPDAFIVRRTNRWSGSNPPTVRFGLPDRPYRRAESYEFDYLDWATLVGWYVAEGWTHAKGPGRMQVGIAQSRDANPSKHADIVALLHRMGIKATTSGKGVRFGSDSLGAWFQEHCGIGSGAKRVPESIRNASPEAMDAFLDAYGKGDGCVHTHAKSCRYVTSSKQLADDLHEMLAKLGRARKARVSCKAGTGRTGPRGEHWVQARDIWMVSDPGVPVDSTVLKRNVARERYTGTVYCVSTPYQTIMVRRKGCPMWSGNSLNVLILFDEAAGIPAGLWEQADSLMTNSNARMLAIGNPTDPQSQFARVCAPGSGWNVIRLDGLRSPLLTEAAVAPFPALRNLMQTEGIPYSQETVPERLQQLLTGPEWINERITRWGVGSSLWQARVRGIFPAEADADAVIPLAWVVAAQDRWEAWAQHRLTPPGRAVIGVDIGRSADADESVAAVRHGHVVFELETWRVKDLTATTGRVAALLRQHLNSVAVVDETGIGAGVLDTLRSNGCSAVGFVASGKSTGTDRNGEFTHLNQRAEAWWRLREALDPAHSPDLCLPPDEQLAADLTTPRWKLTGRGVIQIESKDDIRKRLGRSTDRGDAVVQSLVQSTLAGPDSDVARWGDGTLTDQQASDAEVIAEWLEEYQ